MLGWSAAAVGVLLLTVMASQVACSEPRAATRSTRPTAPAARPSPSATLTGTGAPTPTGPGLQVPTACPGLDGEFEVEGQAGGRVGEVAAQGHYAYLSVGPRLVVLDASDPSQPRSVGETVPGTARTTSLVVAGDCAYTADVAGRLHVISITDPAQPKEMGYCDTFQYTHDLVLAGRHLYLASDAGLHIIDVRDPAHPALVGFYDPPGRVQQLLVQDGLALLSSGDYVSYPYCDLRILDVADPTRPHLLAVYGQQRAAGTYPLLPVCLQGRYAYVLAEGDKLRALDLAEPTQPTEAGSYPLGRLAQAVRAADGRLLLACGASLLTLDLSDPAQPREAARVAVPGSGALVALGGDLAYTLEHLPTEPESAGSAYLSVLHVVDLASPQGPAEVGRFEVPSFVGWSLDAQAYRLAPAPSRLYVAADKAGLQILDLADPARPRLLGSGGIPGFFYDVALLQGEAWAGRSYALVADGSWAPAERAGLRVFEVTDPARISQVGFFDSPGNAMGVAVEGCTAYLADGEKGLRIVDVGDPAHPVEVGACETPGFAHGVAVAGSYAYVADDSAGLRIVDVADPAHPGEVAVYDDGYHATGVALGGDYAYVASRKGVSIVRVADARHPVAVGQIPLSSPPQVAVSGALACVASGESLYAFDVADPAQPRALACLELRGAGGVRAVTIAGGKVYVATNLSGLYVLRLAHRG